MDPQSPREPPLGEPSDGPEELDLDPEELAELGDAPLEKDLPCVRCGYNLRGLKPAGRCPECATPVSKALAFALQRILCPACLAPNHSSAPRCSQCGGPLNTAAATSTYFQTAPIGVRRNRPRSPSMDELLEGPSFIPVIISWIVCIPAALFALRIAAGALLDPNVPHSPQVLAVMWLFVLLGAGSVAIIVFTTRRYNRRLREFRESRKSRIAAAPPPGNVPDDDDDDEEED